MVSDPCGCEKCDIVCCGVPMILIEEEKPKKKAKAKKKPAKKKAAKKKAASS